MQLEFQFVIEYVPFDSTNDPEILVFALFLCGTRWHGKP
jgi:hypothetical protein